MKSFLLYFGLLCLLVAPSRCEKTQNNEEDSKVAYVKASIPQQIYRCVTKFNLLRCLKYFVLLRLEARDYQIPESESSTSEFLNNLLRNEQNLAEDIPENIQNLQDDELNKRLTVGFQKFFKKQPIVLRFIPNVLVKIVPSKSDDLEFSIKKFEQQDFTSRKKKDSSEESDDDAEDEKEEAAEGTKDESASDKGAMRRKGTYLHVGIPLLLAPAMVFAGFLPMLIPLLKLATIFTTIVNSAALVAAILYLGRQHTAEKDVQQSVYFNPGYKERK